MLPAWLTRGMVGALDWLGERVLPPDEKPAHQRVGVRGEEDAYFHLRSLGYVMVARNYRTARCRGEIDLIGWDQDVLCFVEVKTRSRRSEECRGGGGSAQEARSGAGSARLLAAGSTNVPVEVRYSKRILRGSRVPPAHRNISKCLPGGLMDRFAKTPGKDSVTCQELRKDPIVGRWVIISTDRAKRPTDFVRETMKIKGGFCPFCYGNESKTPPEIQAYRPNPNGGPPPQRDSPGWTVRVVPNKFPALGIEGNLNRQAEGMFDRMNGIGAHEVIIETPDHNSNLAYASAEAH